MVPVQYFGSRQNLQHKGNNKAAASAKADAIHVDLRGHDWMIRWQKLKRQLSTKTEVSAEWP